MEGLSVANTDLKVYVHPSKANKVREAVLSQLGSLLFSYDDIFDGIILAYELGDFDKTAKILPGLVPYFGVKVKANLLLFSPKPDMLLEGEVVKLGKESIHVVVLGCCSAAIMLEDIREDLKYTIKDGVRVFSSVSSKRHTIKPGSMIRFTVKSFHEEDLHISGSLLRPETGCIRWLTKHYVEDRPNDARRLKRSRDMDITTQLQEADSARSGEHERPLKRHKSKKLGS